MENKTTKSKMILTIVAGAYLAIVLFLFALNGRYEKVGNGTAVIDKWRGHVIAPGYAPVKLGKTNND